MKGSQLLFTIFFSENSVPDPERNIPQVPFKMQIWKDFLNKQLVEGLLVCSFRGRLEFSLEF